MLGNLTSTGTATIDGTLNVGANMSVTGAMTARNVTVENGFTYRWSQNVPQVTSTTPNLRTDFIQGQNVYRLVQITSRRELKDNIEDIVSGLDIVKKLRPRKYRAKIGDPDPETGELWVIDPNTGKRWTQQALDIQSLSRSYGFVVEEVEEVSKDLVDYHPKNTKIKPDQPGGAYDISEWYPTMYRYVDIVALSVRSIQELCARIEVLESQLNN